MIDRYTTPEMAQIWSEQNKFETWKKVEITVTEVLSDRGEVPKEAVKVINEKAAFSVERILEINSIKLLIFVSDVHFLSPLYNKTFLFNNLYWSFR